MKAKKLVAALLASGYFLSAACRFACAETMSREALSSARQALAMDGEPACHHQASPRSHPRRPLAPCCMMDSGASALVNPAAAAPRAARGLCLGELAVNSTAASRPPRQTLGSDPDPPGSLFRDPVLSSLSPRAPPLPPAVL